MIILARMENTGLRETGRVVERDRNMYPEFEECPEAHVVPWCIKEQKSDMGKACRFAAVEGYEVFLFPKGTWYEAGLEQAKKLIEKQYNEVGTL